MTEHLRYIVKKQEKKTQTLTSIPVVTFHIEGTKLKLISNRFEISCNDPVAVYIACRLVGSLAKCNCTLKSATVKCAKPCLCAYALASISACSRTQ